MTPRPPPSSSPTRPDGSGCTGGPGWRRARRCSSRPPRAESAAAPSSSARRPGPGLSASCGGERKAEVARALGADVVVDRRSQDFVQVVKEVTGGRGADVVYDSVGGEAYTRSTKCIAFEGRILVVGFASGQIPTAALNHALIKNYSIVGLHWGLYQTKEPRPSWTATGSSPSSSRTARSGRWSASGSAWRTCRRRAAAGRRPHRGPPGVQPLSPADIQSRVEPIHAPALYTGRARGRR